MDLILGTSVNAIRQQQTPSPWFCFCSEASVGFQHGSQAGGRLQARSPTRPKGRFLLLPTLLALSRLSTRSSISGSAQVSSATRDTAPFAHVDGARLKPCWTRYPVERPSLVFWTLTCGSGETGPEPVWYSYVQPRCQLSINSHGYQWLSKTAKWH